jgi:hypothetical protein
MPDGLAYYAGSRNRATWRIASRFQNEMGVCFFGIWAECLGHWLIADRRDVERKSWMPAFAGMTGKGGQEK